MSDRRDQLVVRALDGTLSPSETEELRKLAGDDPALQELTQVPDTALEARLEADAALRPRGFGRAVQRVGVAGVFGGMLGLSLVAWVPIALSWSLIGGGSLLTIGVEVFKRMKNRDPYGTIDR